VGLALGLSAALLWGLADYSAAVASRETGALRVVLGLNLFALVVMGALVVVTCDLSRVGLEHIPPFLAIGALGALGYLAFYGALAIGPISVVSPIVSGYAAVTVVLALIVLGESLSLAEGSAIAVVIAGVVLASADLAPGRAVEHVRARGLVLAILAMLGVGGYVFAVGYYAGDLGWLVPIFLARAFTSLFLFGAVLREGGPVVPVRSARLGWTIALLAVLDTGGYVAFNVGIEHADTAIVAAATAPYAVVPIVVGVLILRERPGPIQRAGIAAVVGGVALLALVSS
jgi:drug/metabolite transporter (DMT)-like permease